MNSIEDRLRDAYQGAAETISASSVPGFGEQSVTITSNQARQRLGRIAGRDSRKRRAVLLRVVSPVLAGVAMTGIVLGLVLGRQPAAPARAPLVASGPSKGPVTWTRPNDRAAWAESGGGTYPRYFVGVYIDPHNDRLAHLAVYDATSGKVVADLARREAGLTFSAVAATPSPTAFVVAVERATPAGPGCPTSFGLLRLTGAGRLASLRPLPGAPAPQTGVSGVSVSADGSTLAYTSGTCAAPGSAPSSTGLTVIDLRTGRARHWTGSGPVTFTANPSLSASGSVAAFNSVGSEGSNLGRDDGSGRVLATTGGGSLARASRVVVPGSSQTPGVMSTAISPSGRTLWACVAAAGFRQMLATYRVRDARQVAVLHTWVSHQYPCEMAVTADRRQALVYGPFFPHPFGYRVDLATGRIAPVTIVPPPGSTAARTIRWPTWIAW
ncbi:MAG TPA: hypothetical protein VF843_07530 [Streptosporangiaceae bacterium]